MSIPKEPRQLMINIMYLVLMALLALNVSAEVMDAFQTLDKGNQNSIATVDEQIGETVTSLNDLLEDKSKAKYRVLQPAITSIRQEVQSFNDYVNGLRDTLIDVSGNNDGEVNEGDYAESHGVVAPKGKKNKDVTTRLLVQGPKGQVGEGLGEGERLKERIAATRQRLVDIYSELLNEHGEALDLNQQEVQARIQSVAENMPFKVDDETWRTSNNKKVSWADYKFGHMPLAAVLPLMSQIQSDLKVSEANLVNDIVQMAGGKQIVFDKFFPVFQADKSYVIGGERLNAVVSVGSYSSSLQPENIDLRVNGQRLNIKPDGTADFSLTASGSPGPKTIQTSVAVTNPLTGEVTRESGTFTYEIGTRSVAVSADKMNVFYMGVDNPLTVAAAGVASNDVRVSFGDAITGTGSGNSYVVKGVRPTGVGTTNVTVTAGGQTLGTFPFRVKPIPDPVPTMGGQQGGDIANSTFRAQKGVFAELKNFDFDARCNIAGFNILYIPAREDALVATNAGSGFSGQAAALVGRAKPGDNYTFKNIKAKCPGDAAARDLGTMSFTIR
ncbi:gliding motility-associated protein GldM [Lewinella aquimaris]|uniref:Gliding motility-associated protein GldM n=1 Tax=Neolewinella aquimaris TaxID=1835722 RepID=A0A840E8V2_9BACT|nr:GldM family protein [Neolewinella aquimaris]MBB4080142.1 gliding motility-associated protein GldM [Neolewinella aquimaris]